MIIKKTGLEAAPPFPTSPTVVARGLVFSHDKFRFSPMVNSQEDSIANCHRLLLSEYLLAIPICVHYRVSTATLISSHLPLVHVITRDLIGNRFSFHHSVQSSSRH